MESITLELRPLLCSCNMFIKLYQCTDVDSIQIKLSANNVMITIGTRRFNVHLTTMKIVPNTLSMLKISTAWISFRVQTEPIDVMYGSFGTEIIHLANASTPLIDNIANVELPPNNSMLTLFCHHCQNKISNQVFLKRVLPIPSDECNPDEWFCCTHGENNYLSLLTPNKSDYFYGSYYCVLNSNNISSNVKLDNKTVICSRCYNSLGYIHDSNSIKFWNCCIEQEMTTESLLLLRKITDPFNDFILAVRTSITASIGEELLLYAVHGNYISFLLLKLMERQLNLFRESKLISKKEIHLERACVAKVLYKYGLNKTLPIQHSEVKQCLVTFSMILAATQHLLSSSKRIPLSYRLTETYYIGYMEV